MKLTLSRRLQGFVYFILFTSLGLQDLNAAKSASIVICAETGQVHHQHNPDTITHPASLTKMMTLYLTFKAIRQGKLTFDKKLNVSKHASKQSPSKLYLKPGTTISVRDAIMALVTKSANDAAVVLAEALGKGSEATFAKSMTEQAKKLGMSRTVFKNASGLPNKQQVTTARDMALLSQSLYSDFPEYFKFFKEQKFVYKGQVHRNHNHLLGKVQGVDGIKTGFINASGFNLAASVVRDNRRLIAVVMGGESAKSRDKKMVQLLETTYTNLNGKKSKQRIRPPGGGYASMDDLIHTHSQQGKVQAAKYSTLDVLLNDLDRKDTPRAKKHSRRR